jgi:hypothetical protein
VIFFFFIPEFALEISKFQNSEYEVYQSSPGGSRNLKSVAFETAEISSTQISTKAPMATPRDR